MEYDKEKEVWERQNKESTRAFEFFELYRGFPSYDVKEFYQFLFDGAKERGEDVYDGHVPDIKTLRKWSYTYQWRKRRGAYMDKVRKDAFDLAHEEHVKRFSDLNVKLQDLTEQGVEKAAGLFENLNVTKSSPYQINQLVGALKGINDLVMLQLEKPTEISKAETEIKAEMNLSDKLKEAEKKFAKLDEEADEDGI